MPGSGSQLFLCHSTFDLDGDQLFWRESSSDDLGKVYQTDHPQKSDSLSNTNHSSHMIFTFVKFTRFKRAGGNLQGYYSEIRGVLF